MVATATTDAAVHAQPATATGATVWQIDATHSTVEFSVKHMMFTTVKGRFGDVRGTVTYDEADPARSAVDVEIATASIDTREPQRDAHLRSADFFDAEANPTITFRSTLIEPLGTGSMRVVGDLTMHGVTREVTLDGAFLGTGTNPWGQRVAGFTATGEVNRKDFGLNWNAALEAGGVLVGDNVKLALEVQGSQRS